MEVLTASTMELHFDEWVPVLLFISSSTSTSMYKNTFLPCEIMGIQMQMHASHTILSINNGDNNGGDIVVVVPRKFAIFQFDSFNCMER